MPMDMEASGYQKYHNAIEKLIFMLCLPNTTSLDSDLTSYKLYKH